MSVKYVLVEREIHGFFDQIEKGGFSPGNRFEGNAEQFEI
jgi:hypothetical protein